jgi:hypothetical protein
LLASSKQTPFEVIMQNTLQLRKKGRAASLLALAVMLFLLGSQVAQAASWQVVSSPSPGTYNYLNAVAAVSANDVWAVGNASTSSTLTLIEHYNGTSWQVVSSPSPGATDNSLNGVTAVNATNIWTVGLSQNGSSPSQTLIEHYNSTSWQVVASPNVGTSYNQLDGVATLSASNIWAVGFYRNSSGTNQTLIEHWNGTNWQVVASPNLGTGQNSLYAVAAVRASNIWTVGNYTNNSGTNQTLIEHWNGTTWKIVPSPNSGTTPNNLWGVAAVSATNIWAVGSDGAPASPPTQTLIEHWNGKHWKVVASPNMGTAHNSLSGVTAVSATNIWTVGAYENSNGPGQTLIENWNGSAWKVVPSPNVGTSDNGLSSVAAVSASNLWAIGGYAITMGPLLTLTEE